MEPLKLLFDMDGTIVDTMTSLGFAAYYPTAYEQLGKRTERRYMHDDFKAYNFTNFPEKEADKLRRAFSYPGVFRKALAYPHALETVMYFLNRPESYKVQYVSHFAPDWTLAYSEKVQWLRANLNADIDKDFIVCKDRRNIEWDVLIDDCLDNVWQCSKLQDRRIFVPDRPWNGESLPNNAIRFYLWADLQQYITRIGDDKRYTFGPRMPKM